MVLLTIAALLTASLTAIVGMGGGVLLILVMPGLLPLEAILPVHAVVQSVSNVARSALDWRHIEWRLLPPLLLGSLLGAAAAGPLVHWVSFALLPAVSGVVILAVTWWPRGMSGRGGAVGLMLLGFVQTALGLVAGATGPLGAAVLSKIASGRDWLVVNTGVYMAINHLLRSLIYGLLGFSFGLWWPVITAMAVATVVGAKLGQLVRRRLPERNFAQVFRWLITVLALRMTGLSIMDSLA